MNTRTCFIKRLLLSCCVALGGLLVVAAGGHCGKLSDYSAEMANLDAKGKVESSSMIHVSGGKVRMEMPDFGDKGKMVMIMRPDKKVQWIVNLADKTYVEHPFDQASLEKMQQGLAKMAPGMTHDAKEEDLGTETVNGYKARKKRVLSTTTFMGQTTRHAATVWTAEEFDMPIKELEEDGSGSEMRNIKTGRQPEDLFQVPAGFRKVAGMMEMMREGAMDMDDDEDDALKPKGKSPAGKTGARPAAASVPGAAPGGFKLPEGMQLPPGVKLPGM